MLTILRNACLDSNSSLASSTSIHFGRSGIRIAIAAFRPRRMCCQIKVLELVNIFYNLGLKEHVALDWSSLSIKSVCNPFYKMHIVGEMF